MRSNQIRHNDKCRICREHHVVIMLSVYYYGPTSLDFEHIHGDRVDYVDVIIYFKKIQ